MDGNQLNDVTRLMKSPKPRTSSSAGGGNFGSELHTVPLYRMIGHRIVLPRNKRACAEDRKCSRTLPTACQNGQGGANYSSLTSRLVPEAIHGGRRRHSWSFWTELLRGADEQSSQQ